MRRFMAVLAAGTLALTGVWADDGPITIKNKKPAPGDVTKESKTVTETTKASFTVMGMDQNQEQQAVSKFVYTEEVLEKPAGAKRPTKLKRVYETAVINKKDEKEDLGLAGKTVLIEKSGDTYKITVDGKELTGTAAVVLGKEFRKEKEVTDEHFLPKTPVKVGDTWKIDMAPLARDAAGELDMDADKSSGKGKLIKVYDKGGHKFGTIEVTLDLAVNKLGGGGGQEVELKAGSKLTATAVMDVCIDGTTTGGTAKMTVKGDFTGSTMGIDIKFDITSVTEGTAEEVKK
jgi:hypothetical protein